MELEDGGRMEKLILEAYGKFWSLIDCQRDFFQWRLGKFYFFYFTRIIHKLTYWAFLLHEHNS